MLVKDALTFDTWGDDNRQKHPKHAHGRHVGYMLKPSTICSVEEEEEKSNKTKPGLFPENYLTNVSNRSSMLMTKCRWSHFEFDLVTRGPSVVGVTTIKAVPSPKTTTLKSLHSPRYCCGAKRSNVTCVLLFGRVSSFSLSLSRVMASPRSRRWLLEALPKCERSII